MATIVHARDLSLEAVSPRLVPNDSVLTPAEKPSAVQNYNVILADQPGMNTQAGLYPASTSVQTALGVYNTNITLLTNYLATIPEWNVIPGTYVSIVGADYRAKWQAVYTAKQDLLNAINSYIGPQTVPSGPPSPPTSLVAASEPFGIRITIVPPTITQFIDHYEYRVGASWEVGTVLEKVGGTSYLWQIQNIGTYTFWVRSVDIDGTYSTTSATNSITIAGGSISGLATVTYGQAVSLSWNSAAGSFAIAGYEIRHGSTWDGGTVVDFRQVTTYTTPGAWLGDRTYWVAVLDAKNNYGTPSSIVSTITTPSSVTATRADTVDNNVLLYWTASSVGFNQLNIAYYDVRKGSTYAGGVSIGSNGNSTFTSYFEQSAGSFLYWVAPFDSAGNMGTAVSIAATVSQPPDYIFQSAYNSDLLGGDPASMTVTQTLTNFYYEGGHLIGPVDVTDSWSQHFVDNSWTTPNAQVVAGYPIYNQPPLTTGAYEEVLDYGADIPSTVITLTTNLETITGTVTTVPTISWKLLVGDSWTALTAGVVTSIIPSFRYIKIHYDFTCTSGANLIQINSINVTLAVKSRHDSGTASGTTNYVHSTGVPITFAYAFISANTPMVQIQGSTPYIPVVIYTGGAYPTGFTVKIYQTNGSPLADSSSYSFSWTVQGY
jgi:hypothetical protein